MIKENKKKDNVFVAYFKPFGIKQICDILMFVGIILALVGVFTNETLALAGIIIVLAANAAMLVKNALVLFSKTNRKSPEYRNAIASTCVLAALFLIALFGLIYYFAR